MALEGRLERARDALFCVTAHQIVPAKASQVRDEETHVVTWNVTVTISLKGEREYLNAQLAPVATQPGQFSLLPIAEEK